MSDFFKQNKKDKNIKRKLDDCKQVLNPLLLSNSDDPEISFILDSYVSKDKLRDFIQSLNIQNLTYQFLYFSKISLKDDDLQTQIGDIVYNNRIDFKNYIKPFSKVVTLGRSLYCFCTGNSDLNVESFYDFIFNKTYFYSSEYQSYIFPIDSFYYFYKKDSFKKFFAYRQVNECFHFKNECLRIPELIKIKVDNPEDFFNQNLDSKEVAWDIETSGLNFTVDKIHCITFSFDGKTGYFIKWNEIKNKKLLNEFFKNKFLTTANGKFDCKFLRYNGIENVKVDFDTLNAGHCLNEMRSNSLKTHGHLYTYYGGYEKELDDYKNKYKSLDDYSKIPDSILMNYATMDSIINFQVYKQMKKQLDDISNNEKFYNKNSAWKLNNYYYNVIIPSINTFIDIELQGMCVNWEQLEVISEDFKKRIDDLECQVSKDLNIDKKLVSSNEELGIALENLKLPDFGRTKKGNYNVNEDTLIKWKKQGFDIAEKIEKLHELYTLFNTFIGDKKEKNGYWYYKTLDNNLHPNFGVMMCDSLRNNCKAPNLQNQNKSGKHARKMRSIYKTPSKDFYIMEADASGFQLRIAAALSQDNSMNIIFNKLKGDMHSKTAVAVLKRDISLEEFMKRKKEDELKKIRFKAKGVNFSFLFGSAAFSFASLLEKEWSIDEVNDYIRQNNLYSKVDNLYEKKDNFREFKEDIDLTFCKYWACSIDIRKKFFDEYEGLENWHKATHELVKSQGYVISSFGVIRRLPELLYIGQDDRQSHIKNLLNISLNSPVQNYEVTLINSTLNYARIKFKELNLKSMIIGNVHDSMVLYVYKPELETVKKILKEEFEKFRIENNGIPMELEFEISDYYAEFGSDFYYKNEEDKIIDYRYWGFGKEI